MSFPEPPPASSVMPANNVTRRTTRVLSASPESAFSQVPTWLWLLHAGLLLWGAFTANPLITICALLVPPVLVWLLWNPGEPPVLLFAFIMQWLQAASGIFYANLQGQTLEAEFGGPELAEATWLSLLGVIAIAMGARAALIGTSPINRQALEDEARTLSPVRIFAVYLLILAAVTLVRHVAFRIPSLAQMMLATTSLEWIPVVLLAQAVLTQRRGGAWLALVVAIEFVIGLLGYFSNSKSVFFILAVMLLTWNTIMPRVRLIQLAGIAVFLGGFAVFWTAIKGDYREFISQGTDQQVVNEPVAARIHKLAELALEIDREKISQGFDDALERLGYVTYFGYCLRYVPSSVAYEHGALWRGAIQRVFMPRLFFPGKTGIDDSQETAKYTGLAVAGQEQGTSIGLGYMAESYIDFGWLGMFIPIFLLGVFYGTIYRLFGYRQQNRLFAMGCAVAILVFGAYTIETSNTKLVGGNVAAAVVLGFFYWRFGPLLMALVTEPTFAGTATRIRRPPRSERLQRIPGRRNALLDPAERQSASGHNLAEDIANNPLSVQMPTKIAQTRRFKNRANLEDRAKRGMR